MLYDFFNREGKGIGRGEGENPIKAAMNGGIKEYFRYEEVERDFRTPEPLSEEARKKITAGRDEMIKDATALPKTRKPRADTGKPRAKRADAHEKTKRVRGTGKYYICSGTVECDTKEKLAVELQTQKLCDVIFGKKVVVELRTTATIKPAK